MKKLLAVLGVLVFLAGCVQTDQPLTPQVTQVIPMKVRSVSLTDEQRTYLTRLKSASTMQPGGSRESYNLYGLSKSGRLNDISRHIKLELTAVLAGLRVTGDVALLETTYNVMQNLRGTLSDTNRDGFLNWPYYNPDSSLHGGDNTTLEEIMAHAIVAQGAYALKLNSGLKPKYAEAAGFWTRYLENHFVAKWKQRSGRSSPPYLQKELMHPYADSIRLSHYLWGLTGKTIWFNERDRQVAVLKRELLYKDGRYAWGHFINSLRRDPVFPLQHVNYSGESVTSFADLGFEYVLGEPIMDRFANTVTWMIDGQSPGIMKQANGATGTYYSVLLQKNVEARAMDYPRGTYYSIEQRGPGLLAAWDETGEIERTCKEANNGTTPQPIVCVLVAR